MSEPSLDVVVPGPLEERTGGTIYDRRMVEGLRRLGWTVTVHELAAASPLADVRDRGALAEVTAGLRDGALVVIDHLASAGLPEVLGRERPRLAIVSLVHLLRADEPLIPEAERERRLRLERQALAASAGVIATSPFTAARVRALGVEGRRVRTVIPGTERAARATGPPPGAPPRLLCLASVTPGKGQAVLVSALAELVDVPWTCVCAGSLTRSPAYAREVVAAVRGAELSERIVFPGECDEEAVEELYRTSSVFVLPSAYESYGMVLAEAMAHGLPVVSTTAGAIPQTVPPDAGILVAPGDSAALAQALRSLLDDPSHARGGARARRVRLGAAAYRHASSLPDWRGAASAFAEALTALRAPGARTVGGTIRPRRL